MKKSTKSKNTKNKASKILEDTSEWNLARYSKMCRETCEEIRLGYPDSDSAELWYDLAKCVLENEEGLEAFIKNTLGVKDVLGCLTDDLAYPGNCQRYARVK